MSDTALALQAGFAVAIGAYLLGCGLGTLHRLIIERRTDKIVRAIIADIERRDAGVAALINFRNAQSGQIQGE
ncbi:hypothetical protein IB276_10875 [Ensifer sp. ENS04]|uniref:hypothetical protein n=1 Tax=Ensifer sp. ENS04 TaxID=2769281 RepID=UPI001783F06B|nr:hypothetical protein [Ensifer sp. ENS04]MBD9539954.1 hypothetical protein [Ensifer sp. ENS04]